MCRTFELDYTPLVESGRVPAMVTLTYPGDWECVAPDGTSVKRHMVLWRKRFQREWGEPARYIWKLEFQRRGAPHIHLWMAPPQSPGRTGRTFWNWLSQEWADIVAHPDPEQRARHLLALYRSRRPQRFARLRSQTSGDLLHQTFVAKPRGRQGVSTHRARRLAHAGPRTRPLLGCPRTTASHRGRGHRSGRLPDGPPGSSVAGRGPKPPTATSHGIFPPTCCHGRPTG